ncbi:MAG TPA: cupredoxin domain-containing protein [Patescibacteria group bacterium]|nr:cupredoxin domain-containing protein [Patescibacteria group bacterium]
MNRNIIFVAILLIAVLVGAFIFYNNQNVPQTSKPETFSGDATISMGTDSYSPQNLKIKKGSKVTFLNSSDSLKWPASDLHPSHLIYSEFDPKEPIKTGESWTFQFDKVGEWGYHDHLSPYITGTITVVD